VAPPPQSVYHTENRRSRKWGPGSHLGYLHDDRMLPGASL
jgi:hypothetical protein